MPALTPDGPRYPSAVLNFQTGSERKGEAAVGLRGGGRLGRPSDGVALERRGRVLPGGTLFWAKARGGSCSGCGRNNVATSGATASSAGQEGEVGRRPVVAKEMEPLSRGSAGSLWLRC